MYTHTLRTKNITMNMQLPNSIDRSVWQREWGVDFFKKKKHSNERFNYDNFLTANQRLLPSFVKVTQLKFTRIANHKHCRI